MVAMSANQTRPGESSVDEFIAGIEDDARRRDARQLTDLAASATGVAPVMWGPAIIGFGSRHYRYDSGREGDMPLVSFSPRKAALVLYSVLAADEHHGLAAGLGSHTTGKGCIYIKDLSRVDVSVLERMLANAFAAEH
jgi:hypothetical protein